MTMHAIHFVGPINSSVSGQFIRKCSDAISQGATELLVQITTMGGECSYGFALYNFLRALPIPVNTHNLGTVESMGNILFMAGERRTACHYSKFLIHPFHWTLHGSIDHARMAEYAMSMNYDLELYSQIMLERTQGAAETLAVRDYLKAEPRMLSSAEAVETGLIHAVEELELPADATLSCVHS